MGVKLDVEQDKSLYSNENLGKLKKDFLQLKDEAPSNLSHGFKICSKRFEREQNLLSNNGKYNDDLYDDKDENLKLRRNFFGRTLSPILMDPTKIREDIPKDSMEPFNKNDIEDRNKWNKFEENYHEALLSVYDEELKKIKEHLKDVKTSKKSYGDSDREYNAMDEFEISNKKFLEYNKDKDNISENFSVIGLITKRLNKRILEFRSNDFKDSDAPMMTEEGLSALNDIILNLNDNVPNSKTLYNTMDFFNKNMARLIEFINEREIYLEKFERYDKKDDNKSNKKDDDDDDDSKDKDPMEDEYRKKKMGLARVRDVSLITLIGSIKADINTINKLQESGPQSDDGSIFSQLFSSIKNKVFKGDNEDNSSEESNFSIEDDWNSITYTLIQIIKEATREHDILKTKYTNRTNKKEAKYESSDEPEQSTQEDDEVLDFIINLESDDGEKIGEKYLSERGKIRLLYDCLDPRLYCSNASEIDITKGFEYRKLINKKLKKDYKSSDEVYEIVSNKDQISELKDKIYDLKYDYFDISKKIIEELKKDNNNKFWSKDVQEVYKKINNLGENFSGNDNYVKSYIGFNWPEHKNIFEKEINKNKISNEDIFYRFVCNLPKGKEYLQNRAILSFIYEFLDQYSNNYDQKSDIGKQRENLKNNISRFFSSMGHDDLKSNLLDPKDILDSLSDEEKINKVQKDFETYENNYSLYAKHIFDRVKNEKQIFNDVERETIIKQIEEIKTEVSKNNEFSRIRDGIKPYVMYDQSLIEKEKTKNKHTLNDKLLENMLKSDDGKKILIIRARLRLIYLCLETNFWGKYEYYKMNNSFNKKKYDDLKINLKKIIARTISSNSNNKDELRYWNIIYLDIKNKLEFIDQNILKNDRFNELNAKLSKDKLVLEDNPNSKIPKVPNLNNIDVSVNYDLIPYLSLNDDKFYGELKKAKKEQTDYENSQEFLNKKEEYEKQQNDKRNETLNEKYNMLLENKTVSDYLYIRCKLNFLRIFLETNVFGFGSSSENAENKDSKFKNSDFIKMIEKQISFDQKIDQVYDVLYKYEKFKKVRYTKQAEENLHKYNELIGKYKIITKSGKMILDKFKSVKPRIIDEKTNIDEKINDDISNAFKFNEIKNRYKIIKSKKNITEELKDVFTKSDAKSEMLKNCMSFDKNDFEKELKIAKSFQSKYGLK